MTQRWLAGAIGAVCLFAAGEAGAVGLAVSAPANTPNLGKIVYGSSGATTFTVSTAGAVSQSGGNAIRLTSGGVTLPTITITCGDDSDCNSKEVNVTVVASTANPRIQVTQFTMTALSPSNAQSGSGTTSGASLSFRLKKMSKNSTVTFRLAMQIQVQPGAASGTGDKTAAYTVNVAFN